MKKLFIFAIMLFTLSFTACGEKSNEDQKTTSTLSENIKEKSEKDNKDNETETLDEFEFVPTEIKYYEENSILPTVDSSVGFNIASESRLGPDDNGHYYEILYTYNFEAKDEKEAEEKIKSYTDYLSKNEFELKQVNDESEYLIVNENNASLLKDKYNDVKELYHVYKDGQALAVIWMKVNSDSDSSYKLCLNLL